MLAGVGTGGMNAAEEAEGVTEWWLSEQSAMCAEKYLNRVQESLIRNIFYESADFVNFLLYFRGRKAHNETVGRRWERLYGHGTY